MAAEVSPGTLLVDLTGRGEIALSGKDRVAYLHGLITNDVKGLAPGSGCHAGFLTPKGKLLADLVVLHAGDELVLDCEPPLVATLGALLGKYLFYSEVVVTDRTGERAVIHLCGPGATPLLASLGAGAPPEAPHAHLAATLDGIPVRLVREDRGGLGGYDIRLSRGDAPALLESLAAAGAGLVSRDALEAGRIEAGIPLWGRELDESVLPDEAGLRPTSISETKGCYIGQETVARIKTYGHVNRLLVGLLLPDGAVVPERAEVLSGETRVGHVTSAAACGRFARTVALAYVKREQAAPGTQLAVATPDGPVPAWTAAFPLGPG